MKNWFLVFLLGGLVGSIVAVLALTEPDLETPPAFNRDGDEAEAVTAPVVSLRRAIHLRRFDAGIQLLVLDPETDDRDLASQLEVALFERNWGQVAAVAKVLKGREQLAAKKHSGFEEVLEAGSLLALDHEYRRRALLLELRNRDNPATRLLHSDLPTDEIERELTDLFLAPILDEGQQVVHRDAALLLARLGGASGRELLLREMRENPDPRAAGIAARALALAGDPVASEQLIGILRDDLDPALRARAATALSSSRDLAAGGPVASAVAQVALADTDEGVRSHAIASLARADLSASAMARSALIQLATSQTEPSLIRVAAVAAMRGYHAISKTLPPDLLQALSGLVDTPDPQLRLEVIAALGEAGDADTLEQLELALLTARAPAERDALTRAVEALRLRAVPR